MIADWLMEAMSNLVMSHLLSLLLLVGLNYYIYLKARRTPLLTGYLLLSSGPFLWILGKLLKTVAPSLWLRWSFIMIQYLGMSILGPAFVIFCLVYLRNRMPSLPFILGIVFPSTVLYILVLTNPLHHWFYPVFTFYRDSFGPVFYLLKYEIFICTGIGFFILLFALLRSRNKQAVQSILFILAAAVPLIGSFYYPSLGNLYSGLRFDIVPLCFNLTFLFFGLAVFRYDFLDIPPIARRQVLDALVEGIGIRDGRGRVLYENRAAEAAWSKPGRYFNHREHALQGKSNGQALSLKVTLDITEAKERRRKIRRKTRTIRKLEARERENIRQERELLFLHQRNRAAREIHDLMGHSLTLFIARLEALRLLGNPAGVYPDVKEAFSQFSRWKYELRATMSDTADAAGSAKVLLSEWIENLVAPCKDTVCAVDLISRGIEVPMGIDTVRQVFAAVRESLTNSLRHGRATRILISIHFDTDCRVLVMDNGLGCPGIQEGNGLEGIRMRFDSLGGNAGFSSSPEEGFISRFSFPVK